MRRLSLVLAVSFGLCLPAAAQQTLNVYTYDGFTADWGAGPKVKAAFEKTCNCTLDFVPVEDGVAILNRLKLEGANAKADIALGLDQNLIAEARGTGLFVPSGADLSNLDLPLEWTDDIFVPFDYGYFAVMYDAETVKNPPASLDELINGDAEQKIALQDPRTSTPGLGMVLWMKAVYGDEAAEKWKTLSERVLTVTPGWSESYGLFTKGEVPLVLSYTTSPAYHMIEEKTERYQAAKFAEGHYIQVEVAGMLAASQNKELAKQFLQFMTGPEFQAIIPTANWMLPVGGSGEALPDAFDTLVTPDKTLMFTPAEVAENRKAWVAEWLDAMSR